jgi:hypothetical protein
MANLNQSLKEIKKRVPAEKVIEVIHNRLTGGVFCVIL